MGRLAYRAGVASSWPGVLRVLRGDMARSHRDGAGHARRNLEELDLAIANSGRGAKRNREFIKK